MIDASWNSVEEYASVIQEFERMGGSSIVCLHDILPLLYSQAFSPELVRRFKNWFESIALQCDGVVTNSRTTAESFREYLRAKDISKPGFPVGWWRLGGDFAVDANATPSRPARRLAEGPPYFLGVGTLEPRKGYPIVLDAFERFWAQGVDVRYVIVGGCGWGMHGFERRLREHPEFGRRLYWLTNASDGDLKLLYSRAHAVVLASFAEGFGLPMVEAANYGATIIASDIAVFHEVAGDKALYFSPLDSVDLAARLHEAMTRPKSPAKVEGPTWRDSTAQLLSLVRDKTYQMRL